VAVSHEHLRESQALHLDYYKQKEKKMFHIKETCVVRPRARPRGDGLPLAPTSVRACSEVRRHHTRGICKVAKTPVKWPFPWCANLDVPGRASCLDSETVARPACKHGVGNTGFTPQKKIERISPKSAMRRVARRRIGRIGAKRFAKQAVGFTSHAVSLVGIAAARSDVELCLDELVHGLRVRLATGCLHDLTDEPSDH
jgi:hypothetical protein